MKPKQYTLFKLPIKEIITQNYHVQMDRNTALDHEYLIKQGDSLFFDQIERLRGKPARHMKEIVLVEARKNPRQENELRHILLNGFSLNGIHYSRFGKSASQGKAGITAFVCDEMFDTLYQISQMDIPVKECVISKYEAQRCLLFSSCTLIRDFFPNIVIIGEYQKTLFHQKVKYMVEKEHTFTDKKTGEQKTVKIRDIKEGYRDIPLSPFDGCGCHEKEFSKQAAQALSLDYTPVGVQVRLPFIKGYSVCLPFRRLLKEWGFDTITDIYGHIHNIEEVDCIWNTTMFKGHNLFFNTYGRDAWNAYIRTFHKYWFKIGISKYSHSVSRLHRKARVNFQYLQCLDLWNPRYINAYETKSLKDYNILSPENAGKIITLARYTTDLYEKILKGDKFYTLKFLGIHDTESKEPESAYLKAALTNDIMLKDPAVRRYLCRKLQKAVNEAKVGKIYVDGFYHTVVGDMIGYLEYAAGLTPVGCLKAHEFFCMTMPEGECLSFRSPLVCPSEVNKISIVSNEITGEWFSGFSGQDIVMLNMYDLSAPQQGGMDYDGDIVLLCNDSTVVSSKIDKPIIIDMDDKAMTTSKPYTKENIIEYEVLTRDNRIGEITNAATSIENKYTSNEKVKTLYENYASLLRLFQGKEIDFLKTGLRLQMNAGLRKHLKQLPYFLLYNYPEKLKRYESLREKEESYEKNAYHSPSPMNELCNYICAWEREKIRWDNTDIELSDIRLMIVNNALDLSDRKITRTVRHAINLYANELRAHLDQKDTERSNDSHFDRNDLTERLKSHLRDELQIEEELIANYVIKVSYANLSVSKSFAWAAYGDFILHNLKNHTSTKNCTFITETAHPSDTACEYLGKYYEMKEGNAHEQPNSNH